MSKKINRRSFRSHLSRKSELRPLTRKRASELAEEQKARQKKVIAKNEGKDNGKKEKEAANSIEKDCENETEICEKSDINEERGNETESLDDSYDDVIEDMDYEEPEPESVKNEKMVKPVPVEGWAENDLLPEGWLMKRHYDETQDFILTDSGELLNSFQVAYEIIEDSPEYRDEAIENVRKLAAQKNIDITIKMGRREDHEMPTGYKYESYDRVIDDMGYDEQESEWVKDEFLPEGWKRKIRPEGKSTFNNASCIVDQNGKQYHSRQAALRVLLKRENIEDAALIKDLKSQLIHEGWKEHPLLPPEWRFRDSSWGLDILSHKAASFRSLMQAKNYAKKNYDEMINSNFYMFIEIQTVERREEKYRWEEDETIPKGWKMRLAAGKIGRKFFLAPDGQMFYSRKLGYQHLIKEHFDDEQVQEMRKCVVQHEGWIEHENLPSNWLYKKDTNNKIVFLTTEGTVCGSFISVIEYMKSFPGNYNDKHVDGINKIREECSAELRKMSFDWIKDEYLPIGWKMRTSEGKKNKSYFNSPFGVQFQSRSSVLQHLITEKAPQKDIDNMRLSLMNHEGWDTNSLLPPGWMFKKDSKSVSVKLFTSEGVVCKSFLSAQEYMKSVPQIYTKQNADDLNQMKEETSARVRINTYEWTEDTLLPAGWKMRMSEGKKPKPYFSSPQGIQILGRTSLLQHLIKEGAPTTDIENLKFSLIINEGWEQVQLLPPGWLFKKEENRNFKSIKLFANEGVVFESFLSATEYIKSQREIYIDIDVERINQLARENSARIRSNTYDWTTDPSLPDGWKMRTHNGRDGKRVFFLDNSDHQIKGRRNALRNLIKENYSEEEIYRLRKALSQDGWRKSKLVPEKWRVRMPGDWPALTRHEVQFLTCQGLVLNGFKAAIETMKFLPETFSKIDVNRLNKLKKMSILERRKSSTDWVKGENLPQGWKVKKSGVKWYFLNPDGYQFKGRRLAFVNMIENKYPEEVLDKFRDDLALDGWQKDDLVPPNWMVRRIGGGHETQFLTCQGNITHGFKGAIETMESQPETFSQLHVEQIYKFKEKSTLNRRKSNTVWVKGENLPEDWKMKQTGEKCFFLNPEGYQFNGRKLALKNMILNRYSQNVIDKFCNDMAKDGWERNNFLPERWLVRRMGGSDLEFIAENGELLVGYKGARDMMATGNFNQEDKDRLEIFIEIETVKRVATDYKWETDPASLPEGWRMRVAEGERGKRFYLSPEGVQFPNRRAALQHMLKDGHPEEEVEAMRAVLRHEGWEENRHLPHNWFYKQGSSKDRWILTDEGHMFNSFQSCLDFMKSEKSKYPDSCEASLKILMAEKCNLVRLSSASSNNTESTGKGNSREVNQASLVDTSLPLGWKSIKLSGNSTNYFSPDGKKFQSLLACWQFMLKGNFKFKDMDKIKKSLSVEGWAENNLLPEGWLIKKHSDQTQGFILTDSGELLDSFQVASEIIEDSPEYGDEASENIRKLEMQKNKAENIKMAWKEDHEMPTGWKYRTNDKEKKQFLAPSGRQFVSRKLAYIYMIKANANISDIVTIKKQLMHCDGWEQSHLIPLDWIFKEVPVTQTISHIEFISSEGAVLGNSKRAIDYVKSSVVYASDECIRGIDELVAQRLANRRMQCKGNGWSEDPNLPSGWKLKKLPKNKCLILSADGKQFKSRPEVLQFLSKAGMQEDVKKLRGGLMLEGWRTDKNLPGHWLYLPTLYGSKAGQRVLTPEGLELRSFRAASEYLKKNSKMLSAMKIEKFMASIK